MEVTRANFQEVLDELDSVLKDATFLSIDGEFTGLHSGPRASPFDTPTQYYGKFRPGSMDFLMVQFGLSVFTHDHACDKYSQRSYNFYVFPHSLFRNAQDCRFMCQSSSITFLASQGFDFNKLFTHGISYLTTIEEEQLSKKYEEREKIRETGLDLISISAENKPQIDEICAKIEEFLKTDAEEMSIDRCNAYVRRLVHQECRLRWPDEVYVEAKSDGGGQTLIVYRTGSREEKERRMSERRAKDKEEMREAVGLTALMRKIADSGKLLVGHNMLLDLCHMVHQFFGPLPESYREFKDLIHGLFPRLLDTKVICQSPQFKDTVRCSHLEKVLETVGKHPFSIPEVEPIEGRSYVLSDDKRHEAGYDAYVTGLCFISLVNHLGVAQRPPTSTVLPDSPLLNPFVNKLLLTQLKDFPYVNLEGDDPKISRDHVFHVTFPKEWKLSNLTELFSRFGGVYVSWLSDTTAYVALNRRDQSPSLIKKFNNDKRARHCKIQTFAAHQKSLSADTVPVVSDRKRKSPAENEKSVEGVATHDRGAKSANGEDRDVDDDDNDWTLASARRNISKSRVNASSSRRRQNTRRTSYTSEAEGSSDLPNVASSDDNDEDEDIPRLKKFSSSTMAARDNEKKVKGRKTCRKIENKIVESNPPTKFKFFYIAPKKFWPQWKSLSHRLARQKEHADNPILKRLTGPGDTAYVPIMSNRTIEDTDLSDNSYWPGKFKKNLSDATDDENLGFSHTVEIEDWSGQIFNDRVRDSKTDVKIYEGSEPTRCTYVRKSLYGTEYPPVERSKWSKSEYLLTFVRTTTVNRIYRRRYTKKSICRKNAQNYEPSPITSEDSGDWPIATSSNTDSDDHRRI